MSSTRQEQIKITLNFDATQAWKHRRALKALAPALTIQKGDCVVVPYTFMADYAGDVEKKMRSITKLANQTGVVTSASIDELKFGESVLLKMLESIRALQIVVAENTSAK